MRIAVFTDVHANLPALKAVLDAIRAEGCDRLFHTGDAIAIGPYPAGSLDLLLHEPKIECVMYVNPGSLGCYREAMARYCLVEFRNGAYDVQHRRVSYDDAPLYRTFKERDVPERVFIYKAFFGGRFSIS